MSALHVVERATGEVVETIDTTGVTPGTVADLKAALQINMNRVEYRVDEINEESQ